MRFWILSPCLHFWSDLASEQEKKWQLKHTPAHQILALDELLSDTNPLLANFGKMGREMAKLIEGEETEQATAFLVSKEVSEKGEYFDFEGSAFLTDEPASLLRYIQADLLFLRNPKTTEPIQIEDSDRSVEIHFLPNPLREIEWVHDLVLRLLKEGKQDILVMAPEIDKYLPHIKNIFHNVPYTVSGRNSLDDKPLLTLLNFYSQPQTSDWIKLLNFADFDLEEIQIVTSWNEKYSLMEEGITALIERITEQKIEIATLELLDKVALFIKAIKDSRPPAKETLTAWATWLESLPLDIDKEFIGNFMRMGERIKKPISDLLFRDLVKKSYLNESERKSEHNLGQIRFASLAPMRAQPGEAIILMGMSEGSIPRVESKNSLDLSLNYEAADFAPSKADFDRTLFLECLLSAREHFFITWSETEKPTILVEELDHYLKKGFKNAPSIKVHPRWSHDEKYFIQNSPYPSLNKAAYKAGLIKISDHSKAERAEEKHEDVEELSLISLEELKSLLKDPYKFYRKQNGIKTTDDNEYKDSELWKHSALESWDLRKKFMQKGKIKPSGSGLFNKIRHQAAEKEFDKVSKFFTSIDHSEQPSVKCSPTANLPLYGLISHVTKSGLLVNGDSKPKSIMSALPELLMLMEQDPAKNTLHFVKDSKSKEVALDHTSTLNNLLLYASRAKKTFYPFYPDLIKPIIDADEKKITEKIKDYPITMSAQDILKHFREEAIELFGEIKDIL